MKNSYRIVPRSKMRWFWQSKPVIVYDIEVLVTYWHDPSHGNGGGDWESRWIHFATFDNVLDAVRKRDQFNQICEEQK